MNNINGIKLFPHQNEALDKINKFYNDISKSRAGLVVVPTGGGKTFIAVRWIFQEIKKREVKVIWLAQSFELLNQAYSSFQNIPKDMRSENLNIKVVSSNDSHSSVSEISENDNIIIITTQTAIRTMNKDDNKLIEFINNNVNDLIIVIDEAHHVPAYGCRNLLMKFKQFKPNLWLLGLTATPTYTNVNKRGWLWKIFDGGVIYEVEKKLLQKEHILAKENIIKKKTPMQIQISDEEFNKLTKLHRDIPENIIELIASNTERNNFIINDYLQNRIFYGKTIIFLDRWFQCIYVRDKLIENGIKADAIFYQNDKYTKVRSKEQETNKEIIDKFRNNDIEVLLNVKMFTEGADVPDAKTVFITRDTTSHILLQQMIGRALRGERAGGKKDVANIVLFGDNWDKTIAWAEPEREGDIDDSRIKHISLPMESVSINLMENLIKSITFKSIEIPKYLDLIPIGWYEIEYVSYIYEADEKIEVIRDVVLVYENLKEKYEIFINDKLNSLDEKWGGENLNQDFVQKESKEMYRDYFTSIDNATNKETLYNIIKLCRHIAQNNTKPIYYEFYNRENYNLEELAKKLINVQPLVQFKLLMDEYNQPGSIWAVLYSKFYYFKQATDMYINKILFNISNDKYIDTNNGININKVMESSDLKEQVKATKFRDNNMCLCCGLTSKETKLVVDNILPTYLSNKQTLNNLQTLCSKCAQINKLNKINFTLNKSILVMPKNFEAVAFDRKYIKNIKRIKGAIKSTINIFYECGAVYDINLSRRKTSQYYKVWEIILFNANNIDWVKEVKSNLIIYIKEDLGQEHVIDIIFRTIF